MNSDIRKHSGKKYLRTIHSAIGSQTTLSIDVYEVLLAFNVHCPATQHAIKKLLCAGLREKANTTQDLKEARDAISRAIDMSMREACEDIEDEDTVAGSFAGVDIQNNETVSSIEETLAKSQEHKQNLKMRKDMEPKEEYRAQYGKPPEDQTISLKDCQEAFIPRQEEPLKVGIEEKIFEEPENSLLEDDDWPYGKINNSYECLANVFKIALARHPSSRIGLLTTALGIAPVFCRTREIAHKWLILSGFNKEEADLVTQAVQ